MEYRPEHEAHVLMTTKQHGGGAGGEEETLNSTHQHVSQGVNNSIGILAGIQARRPRVGEEYPYECL